MNRREEANMVGQTRHEIWDDDIDFFINDAPASVIKGINYEGMVAVSRDSLEAASRTHDREIGRLSTTTRARRILGWWASVPLEHRRVLGDPECQDNWGYYTRRNVWPIGSAVEFGALVGAAFAVERDRQKLLDACGHRGKKQCREYLTKLKEKTRRPVQDAHAACRDARSGGYRQWAEGSG